MTMIELIPESVGWTIVGGSGDDLLPADLPGCPGFCKDVEISSRG